VYFVQLPQGRAWNFISGARGPWKSELLAIRPHRLFALSWPIHSAEFIAQPPADFLELMGLPLPG